MKYTENGLKITLEELRRLLERMESCIYIKGGEKPEIKQYCSYAECNAINHTYNAR